MDERFGLATRLELGLLLLEKLLTLLELLLLLLLELFVELGSGCQLLKGLVWVLMV